MGSSGASAETRNRILLTVVKEIVVRVAGDQLSLKLHWHGGYHTELVVRKSRVGKHRFVTDTDTIELIRALARFDSRLAELADADLDKVP